jgi:hypothetical protein
MLFSGDIKGKSSVKPQITVLPVPLPCIHLLLLQHYHR